MLWQIRLTDFSSHTVKLPKIKYVQIKNGVKEGSVSFFINNLTKTLRYYMITISVMIINIEQIKENAVLVICYSK